MRRLSRPQAAEALILDLIQRNQLPPDRRLPSEEALAEKAGMSRTTIRSALLNLERQGVVIRRHGLGTFASSTPVRMATSLESLSSIAGVIRSNGLAPQTEHYQLTTEFEPPADVCKWLDLPDASPVYRVERLYLADEHPAIYVINRIPLYLDGRLIDMSEFAGEVLPFFEMSLRLPIERVTAEVRAVSANRALSPAMSVNLGDPLLLLEQVAYAKDRPVAHSLAYHNSKYITYSVNRFPVLCAPERELVVSPPGGTPGFPGARHSPRAEG